MIKHGNMFPLIYGNMRPLNNIYTHAIDINIRSQNTSKVAIWNLFKIGIVYSEYEQNGIEEPPQSHEMNLNQSMYSNNDIPLNTFHIPLNTKHIFFILSLH